MRKSPNDAIKIAYTLKYKSPPDAPGALKLAGYEVLGQVIKEGWSYYKIEAIAAEYWSMITKAIQKSDCTDLPVDFPKSEQHKIKIKKDNVKLLEVLLE